jgi:transcriptional regulator with XRE-family HTH domain
MKETPLGELVKARRNQMNLTQDALAERVGKSQRWVSNLETGDVKRSRVDTLHKLSVALEIPLDRLVIAAGLADSEESARRFVGTFEDSVNPVQLDGDDPRLPLLDLLEGRSRSEVDSIISMVRFVMGRSEEVTAKVASPSESSSSRKKDRRRTA